MLVCYMSQVLEDIVESYTALLTYVCRFNRIHAQQTYIVIHIVRKWMESN